MKLSKASLFDNSIINEVENEIASSLDVEIYKSNKEIIGELVNQEIDDSNIDEPILLSYFKEHKQKFIEFALLLYRSESEKDIEEEYPKGEKIPKSQRPVTIQSNGLGIGFGITYAIYFHFLHTDKIEELSEYLKKMRIPHSKKFQARLQRYYNEIKRTTTTE